MRKTKLCPLLPIFPGGRPPSIVGTTELNFCVRNGNRWTLSVNKTNYSVTGIFSTVTSFSNTVPRLSTRASASVRALARGAPSGIRTRDPLIKSQLLYQLS